MTIQRGGGEMMMKKKNSSSRTKTVQHYAEHISPTNCFALYSNENPTQQQQQKRGRHVRVIRGRLRVLPGGGNSIAFVTPDNFGSSGGGCGADVLILNEKDINRDLLGDFFYVYLIIDSAQENTNDDDDDDDGGKKTKKKVSTTTTTTTTTLSHFMSDLKLNGKDEKEEEDEEEKVVYEEGDYFIDEGDDENDKVDDDNDNDNNGEIGEEEMWHDDITQMSLWNPTIKLRKKTKVSMINNNNKEEGKTTNEVRQPQQQQRCGRVICIIPPPTTPLVKLQQPSSEIKVVPKEVVAKVGDKNNSKNNHHFRGGRNNREKEKDDDNNNNLLPKRIITGTLTQLVGGRYLLVPTNRCYPRFMCPSGTKPHQPSQDDNGTTSSSSSSNNRILYRATYTYNTWATTMKWPPCTDIIKVCNGECTVMDETHALLVENGVNHGDFSSEVVNDVEQSVASGRYYSTTTTPRSNEKETEENTTMGWKPTSDMLKGRRDYRSKRIFTIDPTTARDLDDALHITLLPNGREVEIGVHIADVSHFVKSGSSVDTEALRRATTVYLVNDVIPMLPRPLCEIACSLNENVERLAFSCVWTMKLDGTLVGGTDGTSSGGNSNVWYGRTVIKSCARLDYATAQNIIDRKVATGEKRADTKYWPTSRQPTGGHTIDDVASDVRLLHAVAMARRRLRFANGALALNGIKLAFQLEEDGVTPKLCAPYPIRESNQLIEEYMLIANYLVAQRLITHAKGRALLRHHPAPSEQGMEQVVHISKESFNFDIDTTNSKTLQESLSRISRECTDELVVQCITESLMIPMKPAEYMAAGEVEDVDWHHFASYYTHFTSPIRRYADVIVHRLLQATLDEDGVSNFPLSQQEIHTAACHCNDMRMAAKRAQERSDRVFLSLYLKHNPITSILGVCLSVGEKTFTIFIPSLGLSTRVFLQEHDDEFTYNSYEECPGGKRRIIMQPKTNIVVGGGGGGGGDNCVVTKDESRSNNMWKSLDINIFAKLEVACTCKEQSPVDVRVKVVGPWMD
jgi:DIS3-like exonuclease 2